MKPSIIFERWLVKNATQISIAGGAVQKQIAAVLFDLKMLELGRTGVTPGMADRITAKLATLRDTLKAKKIPEPDLKLPKIKIVRPKYPHPR